MKNISIVAAVADNLAIGKNQSLLWRLPNDMIFFKNLTKGNTVVMGRKTFESLPKGALPNRTNIVVTRNIEANYPGAYTADSLKNAFDMVEDGQDIYVIGGGEIYSLALPYADKLYITEVHQSFPDADTFFPHINWEELQEVERIPNLADEKHAYNYDFVIYVKKK